MLFIFILISNPSRDPDKYAMCMTTYFDFYKTKSKYKSKIIIFQSLYSLSLGKSRCVSVVYDH